MPCQALLHPACTNPLTRSERRVRHHCTPITKVQLFRLPADKLVFPAAFRGTTALGFKAERPELTAIYMIKESLTALPPKK